MKDKHRYWLVSTIVFIAAFVFVFNRFEYVQALWDEDKKTEILEKKYTTVSTEAYELGEVWGRNTAKAYENTDYINEDNYELSATTLLDGRDFNFYCWAPEDCSTLPTNAELKNKFKVDYGSEDMPVDSFRTGFVDAFVDYLAK